ncbi:arabinose transporter [Silvimonas sp. JCM 19000]
MPATFDPSPASPALATLIAPVMAIIFAGFLIIGLALPVLPRYVHGALGFGSVAVGWVTGAQFTASLLLRLPAGRYADRHGGKRAIQLGLLWALAGGCLYLSAWASPAHPLALALLLAGRGVMGGAESLMITGGMSLGLALVSPRASGRVIAWVGTATFVAFALGAPLGSWLFDRYGFGCIALLSLLLPLLALLASRRLSAPVVAVSAPQIGMRKVIAAVWLPGLGAAFNGVGFSALLAFSVLLFGQRGWSSIGWLPLSAFACALIAARLLGGRLIDRLGGVPVGLCFSVVTALGQWLLGAAPDAALAVAGAALTGVGWAMVYPAFGAEAVRRAGPRSKGLVMAAYSAFPDLAIGAASPTLGLAASHGIYASVYLYSGLAALCALPLALLPAHRGRTAISTNPQDL